ncbi:MAG: hypothetical protein WDN69_02050 [Aliidongia sp.]
MVGLHGHGGLPFGLGIGFGGLTPSGSACEQQPDGSDRQRTPQTGLSVRHLNLSGIDWRESGTATSLTEVRFCLYIVD